MKKIILSIVVLTILSNHLWAQERVKPKIVVGLVVDQMRWDYLYKFKDRYGSDGFKRLQSEGFSVENTYINHTPSKTAVGHATIFTGSVPAIHGITGNSWIERYTGEKVYCVGDTSVRALGINNVKSGDDGDGGQMSPRNLLVNTVADELKLATNFRSKVVGVSLKDRAAILPSGHSANAAFWYDDNSAKFISSTYYMKELPSWVNQFNQKNEPAKLMSQDWKTLYPIKTYTQSSADDVKWEGLFKGHAKPTFPYPLSEIYKVDKSAIRATPFGNDLTLSFAKAAIEGYQLGEGADTDFLTVNLASTDYVGHKFGPNAIEIEDVYLRLDKTIASFLKYLDSKYGKGNYLIFLTADHGVAHSLEFLEENKMPNGQLLMSPLRKSLNEYLEKQFKVKGLIEGTANYGVYFKMDRVEGLDFSLVKQASIRFLEQQAGVLFAIDVDQIGSSPVPEPLKTMVVNGNNRKRTGSILIVPNAGYLDAAKRSGSTHAVWNPYDTHIPLLFMGWGVKSGATNRIYHQNDIAITLSNLLKIQAPNGNVGVPILELLAK
ncbi:MAG: alkaline phosphatase family protein [Pedobacter sp.]|uniref:alkaline phosphatase PafA n=1 Tax=Pedobacter sp. TaxID=1411316 RepID=UPI0028068F16|nr:alkaline phosphatase PafA [Pedobacter sp.]MDQ8005539.1 alkaline phosphatase family protein [Pedobacter sp.]